MPITLDHLRHFAIARSLHPPATLKAALDRCGFVQADPIRAPARAQDLTLRHRVANYRAGDLDRLYSTLDIEEDTFINYGFLPRAVHALMHPRGLMEEWPREQIRRAQAVLQFVRDHGTVHPRDVDSHFSHGSVINYWGGSSSATTHLLDAMHYAGMVRIARREAGIRIYAARDPEPGAAPAGNLDPAARVDSLVDVVVHIYAPLPAASLSNVVSRLRYAVPQFRGELKGALQRAKVRLAHARVDGVEWYWPEGERLPRGAAPEVVRLLSPFDPIVWDRRRFELLWGWAYRFEAYTPADKRKLGYYALPLVWRDRAIGWGNVSVRGDRLRTAFGFVKARPRDPGFKGQLEAEVDRMQLFLNLQV